jgi:hypothetical protein
VTTQSGIDGEAIRGLVREVLAELLPAGAANGAGPIATGSAQTGSTREVPAGPDPGQAGLALSVTEHVESVEVVSLRNDADLARFVMHVLHLFENPKHRDAVRAGRLRFRLAAAAVPGSVQPSLRVDKGAVTEAMVTAAAKQGARLVLGPRAVLTPLGRDRARAAGVEIVKER